MTVDDFLQKNTSQSTVHSLYVQFVFRESGKKSKILWEGYPGENTCPPSVLQREIISWKAELDQQDFGTILFWLTVRDKE